MKKTNFTLIKNFCLVIGMMLAWQAASAQCSGPVNAQCASDLELTLVGGMATLTPTMVNNGSTVPCGTPALKINQEIFTCDDVSPVDITLTVTDSETGTIGFCTTPVTLTIPAPTMVCSPFTVTLGATGNATITGADIDGGSTGACGDPVLTVAPSAFTCEDVGVNTVTLTGTDPSSGATATCDAMVTVLGSTACLDGFVTFGNDDPSIADPCVCDGVGGFDEEVIVHGIGAGEMWSIIEVTGVTYGAGGAPVMVGDMMTDLGNGDYVLTGLNHLDGVGYEIVVQSPFFPGLTLIVSNTCFYPLVVTDVPFDTVSCLFTDPIPLVGDGVSQSDGVTPIDGVGEWRVNGIVSTELDPQVLGTGTHTVEFCFDAGAANGLTRLASTTSVMFPFAQDITEAQLDPGCEVCVTDQFVVLGTTSTIACNDRINVSLEGSCSALITPDMVLEGSYVCYDDYAVTLKYNNNVVANPVDYSLAGQVIITEVEHLPSGNKCWGELILEDKWAPELNCDIEFLDKDGNEFEGVFENVVAGSSTYLIPCTIDPADVPAPTATDNCTGTEVYLISENVIFEAACNAVGAFTVIKSIERTYGVKDINGNEGNQCTVGIQVYQVPMQFPDDITWTCEQYAANNTIVDATALHPLILANIVDGEDDVAGIDAYAGYPSYGANTWWLDNEDLDVTLDPNWDDDRDNCSARSENDADDCKANFAGNFVECPTGAHTPNDPDSPIHNSSLINGLEDADVLALTGSGIPRTSDQHEACKHSFIYIDQIASACEGADITKTFKIIRTWTALNWCTGATITDVQIIKVLDKVAPVISFPNGFEDELIGNQSIGGAHPECGSDGFLSPAVVTDNCSDVKSLRVFTPVGEASPEFDGNGDLIGYRIPEPYLSEGDHDITYEAIDNCGNVTTIVEEVTVEDGILPVPICREITNVSLSSSQDGIASVPASYFDEASYDNCGPVYFKVRRMDDNCRGFVNDRRRFNDEVNFCCDDIGETINVILRVYDVNPGIGTVTTVASQNNANDCMIEVEVEDKSRPECYAPANVWLNCSEVADNTDWNDTDAMNAQYGEATGYDNCSYIVEDVSVSVDLDLCGVGSVTRTFRTVDGSDNRSVGTCRQVIMIQPVTDYCITFPADFSGECNNSYSPAELTYEEIGCDLLAISKERLDFFAGGPDGECKKEIYTWQVINWCEYDGISPFTEILRDGSGNGRVDNGEYCSNGVTISRGNISYPSTGYYQWEQHVKIFDDTAPEISYDGDVEFCGGDLDEDPCTGRVDIALDIEELCTDQITTTWEISAFADAFGNADLTGSDNISMRLPLGTHTARFTVADDCGNVSQLDVTFTIIDCKAPTPVCYNGLSVSLMPSRFVSVWASDFDASSFDYCHDFEVTANIVTDRVNDGVINEADYTTVRPTDTEIVLDCDDVGSIVFVQLWVHELSGDGVNDDDYCVTYIEVQDNGVCTGSRASIAGNTADEKGENIENVDVNLSVDMTANFMTTSDGAYTFDVNQGGDYTVTPMKTDDVRNGVSTFDLALISKHVLNIEPLNSPYKIIAADANNSGSVTTLDLVAIRKLVLFVTNEFPNNTSWRFVDKDFIFTNPQNPFASVFPEVKNFNNVAGANVADFVGIKIGDVSGDAKANGLSGIDDRSFNGIFNMNTEDKAFEAGEEVRVTIDADLQSIDGYQATLNFNTKAVELTDIESATLTKENFGTTLTDKGIITLSWNGEAISNKAFTLVFSAKAAGTLSDILSVGSNYTKAEAYNDGDFMNVGLNFGGTSVAQVFSLHQNTPNPFKSETTIGFELPQADAATLTISDLSGKVLRVIRGNYEAGFNSVVVQMTNSLPMGVLIYELETSTDKATKKMTVVR